MIRRFLKFAASLIFAALLVAGALFFYAAAVLYPAKGATQEDKLFLIAQGSSTRAIARQLEDDGFIDSIGQYIFLAAVKIGEKNMRAGEFEIKAGASIEDIVTLFHSGKTYQRKITIAEGLMSFEIINAVMAAEALEGDIADVPAEGSMLPETYSYTRGETRQAIIDRMQKSMQDTVQKLWPLRAENLPVKTPEEAVILASVVEKETGIAAERARVAGVFINRMNIGMPLQSDPTVIYAVTLGKSKLDRPIYRRDLGLESPYNTYLVRGLPPTPIANPGKESIAATLNPEKHDYLYFVADGTGGHVFAKTHEEHLRNVAKWREIERRGQ